MYEPRPFLLRQPLLVGGIARKEKAEWHFYSGWRRRRAYPPSRRRSRAPSQTGAQATPFPLGHTTLRVIRVRDEDADQPPVLVVEDVAE